MVTPLKIKGNKENLNMVKGFISAIEFYGWIGIISSQFFSLFLSFFPFIIKHLDTFL